MNSRQILLVATLLTPPLLASARASAQTAPAPVATPAPKDASATNKDDIIITATKRSENIQNVPIAVSAYGAEQLQRSGVRDLRELQGLSPSLNVGVTSSDATGAKPPPCCNRRVALIARLVCPTNGQLRFRLHAMGASVRTLPPSSGRFHRGIYRLEARSTRSRRVAQTLYSELGRCSRGSRDVGCGHRGYTTAASS